MSEEGFQSQSLFDFCTTGGCAAKLNPADLHHILQCLPVPASPDLIVGFEHNDDAAVYRLSEENALAATVDVIAPPVDDPHVYGQIAASNALSDVYAVGGNPKLCLSILAFPEALGSDVITRVLVGACEKIREAGAFLVGGHTVRNDQLLFGLAVMGFVHPGRVWTNCGAQEGDVLVLTKAIGTGVLFSACRQQKLSKEDLAEAIKCTTSLNASARDVLSQFTVHSVTDVTGFGLAGHALEMARASQVTIRVDCATVPIFKRSRILSEQGVETSITQHTIAFVRPHLRTNQNLASGSLRLLFDPQTNGGLLAAVQATDRKAVVEELRRAGLDQAACVGRVERMGDKHLIVD